MDNKHMLSPKECETGVWLTYTSIPRYMKCRCSKCGADILVPYVGDNVIFNFCPNCGEKMRGMGI